MILKVSLLQVLVLAISFLSAVYALPSLEDGQLFKRRDTCQLGDTSLKSDKAFKISQTDWAEDVFSNYKAGNIDVTFTFSNGGGIRGGYYMKILNKSSTDYLVFVKADRVFFYDDGDNSATITKAFKVKGKSSCRADIVKGATIGSIKEVDAQKA